MTRIALISDLHGNRIAAEAVFRDIRSCGVDATVCLGDVATLGPEPREVLSLVRDAGCRCVVGNHDAFLLEPGLVATYTTAPAVVDAIAWCEARLTPEDRAWIASFEDLVRIPLDGQGTLVAFHGSPRSNVEDVLPTTPPERLDEMLGSHGADVLACGHTHLPMVRQHQGVLLVNPGSVGMPFKAFAGGGVPVVLGHAEYGILEATGGRISVSLRRVPLDRTSLQRTASSWGTSLGRWLATQYR